MGHGHLAPRGAIQAAFACISDDHSSHHRKGHAALRHTASSTAHLTIHTRRTSAAATLPHCHNSRFKQPPPAPSRLQLERPAINSHATDRLRAVVKEDGLPVLIDATLLGAQLRVANR